MTLSDRHQPAPSNARRLTFLIGGVVTGVLALSIHMYVLAVLNVPGPASPPAPGVLTWIDGVGRFAGALLICHYTIEGLRQRGWGTAGALLIPFVLFAMFSELLFRLPLMNGVVSQSIVYPVVSELIRVLPLFVMFLLCALVTICIKDPRWLILASVAVWACFRYLFATPLKALAAVAMSHAAALERPGVYSPPYDWHVYVPAYLTYAEPVAGIFLLLALVWDRLPGRDGHRWAMVLLMLLLAKGLVITPLAYAFAAPPGARLTALLSMGQFTLESAALILLAIATRRMAHSMGRGTQLES